MIVSTLETNLDWQAALRAIQAATDHASKLGIRIHVAVVDRAGLDLAFLSMNGAFLHSADIARDKAYTCLLYTSPSPRDKRQSRMPSSA